MEETIKIFKLDAPEGYDYYYEYQEVIDLDTGGMVFRVNNLAECPEDAIIGRSLFDAHDWLSAVKYGIELAQQGYTNVGFEMEG